MGGKDYRSPIGRHDQCPRKGNPPGKAETPHHYKDGWNSHQSDQKGRGLRQKQRRRADANPEPLEQRDPRSGNQNRRDVEPRNLGGKCHPRVVTKERPGWDRLNAKDQANQDDAS